jgi:hypothetical protein
MRRRRTRAWSKKNQTPSHESFLRKASVKTVVTSISIRNSGSSRAETPIQALGGAVCPEMNTHLFPGGDHQLRKAMGQAREQAMGFMYSFDRINDI